eukprot:COSAG05_NODE_10678_length_552_cov_0.940397_1_plen_22_part_10
MFVPAVIAAARGAYLLGYLRYS